MLVKLTPLDFLLKSADACGNGKNNDEEETENSLVCKLYKLLC